MNMALKIAIQKSGRLHDDSIQLLKDCGIAVKNGHNQLKSVADNFPLEVYFLRDDDIPQYVEDNVAHIGIVGENVLFEKDRSVEVVEQLGFGKCRLSIAVQKGEQYANPDFLQGKKIATSYPVLTQKFLEENKIIAEIHEISGSVELAPRCRLRPGKQWFYFVHERAERGANHFKKPGSFGAFKKPGARAGKIIEPIIVPYQGC
jgi:ATP phosphoribosyltransferase